MTRPMIGIWLLFGFADDAERDSAIEGHALQLDVEPVAVSVRPDAADAGPEPLLAVFAIADLISDVAGAFVRVLSGCSIGHKSLLRLFEQAATIAA